MTKIDVRGGGPKRVPWTDPICCSYFLIISEMFSDLVCTLSVSLPRVPGVWAPTSVPSRSSESDLEIMDLLVLQVHQVSLESELEMMDLLVLQVYQVSLESDLEIMDLLVLQYHQVSLESDLEIMNLLVLQVHQVGFLKLLISILTL